MEIGQRCAAAVLFSFDSFYPFLSFFFHFLFSIAHGGVMGVASISVRCWILALLFAFHFFLRARVAV